MKNYAMLLLVAIFFIPILYAGTLSKKNVAQGITIYEDANYQGRNKALMAGRHRLRTPNDFNDVISSIKIPRGVIVIASENANDISGYGETIILDADMPTLPVLNDNISNIIVVAKDNISFSKLPTQYLENAQEQSDILIGSDGNFYTVSASGEIEVIEIDGKTYDKVKADAAAPTDKIAFILPWKIKHRDISQEEYNFAKSIFFKNLPSKNDIRISNDNGAGDRAYVMFNIWGNIVMHLGKSYSKPLDNKFLFVHELTHVWQIGHYGKTWYLGEIAKKISSGYAYTCNPKNGLDNYNFEQMGDIVRDWYFNKNNSCLSSVVGGSGVGVPPPPPPPLPAQPSPNCATISKQINNLEEDIKEGISGREVGGSRDIHTQKMLLAKKKQELAKLQAQRKALNCN